MRDGNKVHVDLVYETNEPEVLETFAKLTRIGNVHRVVANSPTVFTRFIGIAHGLRFNTKIDPCERELAILCVLEIHDSEYELAAHRPYGVSLGLNEAQVENVRNPEAPGVYSDRQKAILRFAERVAAGAKRGADLPPCDIEAYLDNQERVEMALTLAFYIGQSYFTGALDLPAE